MAAAGWGAVGGSAWGGGTTTTNTYEEAADSPRPAAPQAANPTYGGPIVTPAYQYEDNYSQPAAPGGFGSTTGAYGQSPAGTAAFGGGGASFNHPPAVVPPRMTEAQLARKEAELAAKEKQLKELEATLIKEGKITRKNWPFCYPILYHNIAEEIPPDGPRRIVREGYMAWWGLMICLCWNFFCACIMLGQKVSEKVPSWFLSILYLLLGVPLGFWLWYKRLYNGAKADSTLGFAFFFLWFAVHCGFCIWAAIAVPFSAERWSFAGFITAFEALDVCTFCGIIYLVGAGLWSVEAAWSCWVMCDVFLFWRGKGGVQEVRDKAKKEAALAAFRAAQNPNGQQV